MWKWIEKMKIENRNIVKNLMVKMIKEYENKIFLILFISLLCIISCVFGMWLKITPKSK